MKPKRRAAITLVAVLGLAGPACSSKSPEPVACPSPVSSTTVTVVDYAFDPMCTGASPGATLTVKNTGAIPHTFTVTGTSIDVPLAVGETKQVPLTGLAAGTYAVVCTLHPQMRGSLKVG